MSSAPSKIDPKLAARIQEIVDAVPEVKTYGLILACNKDVEVLRAPAGHDQYLMLHVITSELPKDDPFWKKRSFWKQLGEAGLNCGGAAITAVGAVGLSAAAPASFGASALPAWLAWGGAVAGAAQCGVSIGKTVNFAATNDEKVNDVLTEPPKAADLESGAGLLRVTFFATMYTMDVVATASAVSGFRDFVKGGYVRKTGTALKDYVQGFGMVETHAHRTFSASRGWARALLVQNQKVLRQKVLEAISGAAGLGGQFYFGGVLKDIVVAIVQAPAEGPRKQGEAYWRS